MKLLSSQAPQEKRGAWVTPVLMQTQFLCRKMCAPKRPIEAFSNYARNSFFRHKKWAVSSESKKLQKKKKSVKEA